MRYFHCHNKGHVHSTEARRRLQTYLHRSSGQRVSDRSGESTRNTRYALPQGTACAGEQRLCQIGFAAVCQVALSARALMRLARSLHTISTMKETIAKYSEMHLRINSLVAMSHNVL
jgi:hypothetical protein